MKIEPLKMPENVRPIGKDLDVEISLATEYWYGGAIIFCAVLGPYFAVEGNYVRSFLSVLIASVSIWIATHFSLKNLETETAELEKLQQELAAAHTSKRYAQTRIPELELQIAQMGPKDDQTPVVANYLIKVENTISSTVGGVIELGKQIGQIGGLAIGLFSDHQTGHVVQHVSEKIKSPHIAMKPLIRSNKAIALGELNRTRNSLVSAEFDISIKPAAIIAVEQRCQEHSKICALWTSGGWRGFLAAAPATFYLAFSLFSGLTQSRL